ncbi:MAG: hypothetical protein U1F41_15985 [Burkholderiales bacterium]
MPLLDLRWPRLVLTQLLKKSPVNLRPLLGVPPTVNSKGIALFLSGFVKLRRAGLVERTLLEETKQRLVEMRCQGESEACWGYSFPWQTRTVLVPRNAPNLVATTYAANALIDAFEDDGNAKHLELAASAARYLCDRLLWSGPAVPASFAYPTPDARVPIHNANLLGAALLCRIYQHTGDQQLLTVALEVARYSVGCQAPDGSWAYGESPRQQWIDNFHTGFNLCALSTIGACTPTREFESSLERGLAYFLARFFRTDGAPCYFSNRCFPIDIHSAAQSIITLHSLRTVDQSCDERARRVLDWTLAHMWSNEGYFYYQVRRLYAVKIPYMRWAQAWMLLALATMLNYPREGS